jgi:hypothetical protein
MHVPRHNRAACDDAVTFSPTPARDGHHAVHIIRPCDALRTARGVTESTTLANGQAERLPDVPELVVDPDMHIDQLTSDDQQRLALGCGPVLSLHCLEPTDANHFGHPPASRCAAPRQERGTGPPARKCYPGLGAGHNQTPRYPGWFRTFCRRGPRSGGDGTRLAVFISVLATVATCCATARSASKK